MREFDKQLKQTKAVDEAGNPLVVFHGTSRSFKRFDASHSGKNFSSSQSGAFYFINDEAYANQYADAVSKFKTPGKARVLQANLLMLHPKRVDCGNLDPNDYIDQNSEVVESARKEECDGIIVSAANGLKTFIVFDPSNIKIISKNNDFHIQEKISAQAKLEAAEKAMSYLEKTIPKNSVLYGR